MIHQGHYKTHVRIPDEVSGYAFDPAYSWWSTIVAEGSTNLIQNPSFERLNGAGFVDEYSVNGTWEEIGEENVIVTYPAIGAPAGRRIVKLIGGSGLGTLEYDTAIGVTPGQYTFSLDLYVENPPVRVVMSVRGTGPVTIATRSHTIDQPGWRRLHLSYEEMATSTRTLLLSYTNPVVPTVIMYTDAWQFERKPYPTTYLDGDFVGFQDVGPYTSYFWHGTPHGSPSTRIANTGSGGYITSWSEVSGFRTTSIVGLMMPPFEQEAQTLANGKQIHRGVRAQTRDFTVTGRIFGRNPSQLFANHNELERLLRPNNTSGDDQLIVRYQQVDDSERLVGKPVDVICVYNDGLRGGITNFYQEAIALQFAAVQPELMETYQTSVQLTLVQELVNNHVLYRDESGEYFNLGTGATLGGIVHRIGFLRDGRIVAFGNYTDLAGSGTENGAVWDGAAWTEIASSGNNITDIDDGFRLGYSLVVAAGAEVREWNEITDAWTQLGTDFSGAVNVVQRDGNGDVWIGGAFVSDIGVTTTFNNVARWDYVDEEWVALGDGLLDPGDTLPNPLEVKSLIVPGDGYVYLAGTFTEGTSGAVTTVALRNVARWDIENEVYRAMGSGFDAAPEQLLMGQDGFVYAVGPFSESGDFTPFDLRGFARWNGYSWEEVFPLVRPGGVYGADGFAQDEEGIFWFYNTYVDDDDLFDIEGLGQVPFFGWRNGVFYPPYIANATIRHLAVGPGNRVIHATFPYGGGSPPMLVPAMTRVSYAGTANAPLAVRLEGPGRMSHVRSYTTEGGVYGRNTFQMAVNESVTLRNDLQRTLFYSNHRRNLYPKLVGGATNMAALRLIPGENRISVFVPDADEDESEGWLIFKNRYWAIGDNA